MNHCINLKEQHIVSEVHKLTERGVDIVIDHRDKINLANEFARIGKGGNIGVCGMTTGNDAIIPIKLFYQKQIQINGTLIGTMSEVKE